MNAQKAGSPGNSDFITSPPRIVLNTLKPMNSITATTTGSSAPK